MIRRIQGKMRLRWERNRDWKDSLALLSVYHLADAEGLYCDASLGEIAEDASFWGLGRHTLKARLQRLADRGILILFNVPENPLREDIIILPDHPDSRQALAALHFVVAERKLARPRGRGRAGKGKGRGGKAKPR